MKASTESWGILQILAREIYDSPLALVRENVQNAYDAVRMRFAPSGVMSEGGRIDVRVGNGQISISDNGVGMTETVLRENFWKAGSSGKHSETARKAGVVGTFGIGAIEHRLHPVGQVLGGMILHPVTEEILRFFDEFSNAALTS